MHSVDMVAFVDENLTAFGLRTVRGSLEEALNSGTPCIAVVDDGHAVLVQGRQEIDGEEYLIVRDPQVGAYYERLEWFVDQRLVTDRQVLGWPAIWGEL